MPDIDYDIAATMTELLALQRFAVRMGKEGHVTAAELADLLSVDEKTAGKLISAEEGA